MKKIKLLAPLMGVSLTCATAMSIVSCAGPSDTAIKVSLGKDVEHITLKTEPKNPSKGKKLVIILTADENYTIDSTSIEILSDEKEVEFVTDMSEDNTVATLVIEKDNVNGDMSVIAEAQVSEDGKSHNYLGKDGSFVPYVPTHDIYSGSTEFASEEAVFVQYMTDASEDFEIIEDDYLYSYNEPYNGWFEAVKSMGGTVDVAEAKIKIDSIVFDSTNEIYKLTGHVSDKIVFTIPEAGTLEQSTDTYFTNAYIDYGKYEVESEVWDRTVGCSYKDAVYTRDELLELTDWKVEGQGKTQAGKVIVGSFNYDNWENEDEPGSLNTDFSFLCDALQVQSPRYMSSVPYIDPEF